MKEQAEFYRVGLLLGLISLSDAVAWCDSIITAEEAPDIGIIEASISGSQGVSAVAAALTQVEGEFDYRTVTKRIFRAMYDLVKNDRSQAHEVASMLYQMASENDLPSLDCEAEMWAFCDAIHLAAEGILGDKDKLIDEMVDFLEAHSASAS